MPSNTIRWIALLAIAASGCTAEPPIVEDPEGNPGVDAGVEEEQDGDGGVNVEVPLEITTLAESTYWDTAPVRGVGPARGTVLVETANHGTMATELGSDGSFCIDIPLDKDQVNVLGFQAINQDGIYSDEKFAEIRQEGTPPEAPEAPEPVNAALGATASRMSITATGDLAALTDGSLATSVFLENAMFGADWIMMTLDAPAGIEVLTVASDPECPMEEYQVWMTEAANPEDPSANPEGDDWALVYHMEGGDGYESFLLNEPTVIRHIAIVFLSSDCGSFYETGEHIVTEIQAWTPEGAEPPSENAPTCFGA